MLKSQPFFLEKKYHCEERELAFNPAVCKLLQAFYFPH